MLSLYVDTLSRVPALGLVLLAAVSVILGDYGAKAWSEEGRGLYLAMGFIGYFFSAFFYIPSLLKEDLIITSVLWVLLSTIGFLVIGAVIFKEVLSPVQIGAVVLGIVSICILTFAK
jgi:multidrug transporter EmrE-like cation transporter